MPYAPMVNVAKVRSYCGHEVDVEGWVSKAGARFYMVDQKPPGDPGYTFPPNCFCSGGLRQGEQATLPDDWEEG